MTFGTAILRILAFAAAGAWAGMSVEYDPERVEAGKSFALSLVVPLRELPEQRGIPHLDGLGNFQYDSMDSVDSETMDFFRGPTKVRKYRFHLKAPGEGHYELGPIQWEIAGKTRDIGRIKVNVERSYDAPGLGVSVVPSRSDVYEGEQFSLMLSLVAYDNIQGQISAGNLDLGDGFWTHRNEPKLDFQPSQKPGVRAEASSRLAWLAATRAGELTIPAISFKYTKMGAPKVVEKRVGNFYSKSVTQEPEEAQAKSSPVRIRVRPLPETGKPAGFSGLVGHYSLEVKADRTTAKVGEAVTLSITLQGDGRPGAIPDPRLPDFSEFRTVPPESKVDKIVQGSTLITRKQIKIFLYPRRKGEFTIGPVSLDWFDPTARAYRSQSSPEIALHIERGDSTAIPQGAVSGLAAPQQKDIEQLGTDIRHFSAKANLEGGFPRLQHSPLVWSLLLLPWLLAWGIHRYSAYRRRHRSNAALVRREGARKRLHAALATAKAAARTGDARSNADALDFALVQWISDLCNVEVRGMTRTDAAMLLRNCKVAEDLVEQVLAFWKICDATRFAPPGSMEFAELDRRVDHVETLCEVLGGAL